MPANHPIPTSKGHWLLGNLPSMNKDILVHMQKGAEEHGDTYYNPVPGFNLIITGDPEFMRYVLQQNHRNYYKGISYEVLKLVLGNGLVTSNGDFWKKQRRLAQPAFHKKNLEGLFENMKQVTEVYLQGLEQKRGTTVDFAREMMVVTAQVALKSLFSDQTTDDLDKVYDSMTIAQRYVSDLLNAPYGKIYYWLNGRRKEFKQNLEVLDKIVIDSIAKRRASGIEETDLLQMFMGAVDEDTNEQMNDKQLRDEMITIFSAGHETSANGLAWLVYQLLEEPEVVEKMMAEIKAVVGDQLPGFDQLRDMPYTRQVIEEGLRMYPPVWGVSRTAKAADEFNGIKIKKNQTIFCTIYNSHHNQDLFPNPDVFDPDRFSPERKGEIQKMSYLPFGGGPRLCIGNMFALMEMQLILVGLFQRFRFELIPDQKIEMEALITVRPRYGMKMSVI